MVKERGVADLKGEATPFFYPFLYLNVIIYLKRWDAFTATTLISCLNHRSLFPNN